MHLPNYHNGSIVNLMSSLLQAFGGTSAYNPLELLPPSELESVKNVILFVIDGFGYNYLLHQTPDTFFHKHLQGKITSVFPSTTASGITTFLTGLAPQQHAVTGWFMHLKEIGSVAVSLRFQPRCCEASLRKDGVSPETVFGNANIYQQIQRQSYSFHHREIAGSDYNTRINQCPQKLSFTTMNGCLRQLKQTMIANHEKKFLYAYWGNFDELCHEHGTRSQQVNAHYQELVKKFTAFAQAIRGTDTLLLITADHGLIDTAPGKIIEMKMHPTLRETLILPLCGEPRVAYCYVRPSKTQQFERYIQQHFRGMCDLYRSEELIERKYFGLFAPDSRLHDRIGDYVLIMRDNYIIKDFLLGEEEKMHLANHGGLSAEEMFIPLIVVK
ncbi:type I phosphodiesterase/nucleotide pyrophosphatase [Candidatus Vecturithrix granuli]|uniref:Type I phosphodiesterase/nucleotide pyrophosphatase n=1 Tax=Vecturithrix granuli TaxID=1499967 RepID=A0A081C7I4_VECG1|nr:type I phosphodiesterase/nucleotide pyrophosphatase [Candidatus Vecturithrix granuli]